MLIDKLVSVGGDRDKGRTSFEGSILVGDIDIAVVVRVGSVRGLYDPGPVTLGRICLGKIFLFIVIVPADYGDIIFT